MSDPSSSTPTTPPKGDSDPPPPTERGDSIFDEATYQASPTPHVGPVDEDGEVTERHEARPPAFERTMPVLTVLAGPRQGRLIQLAATTCVGRGKTADVVIDDAGISREHARIKRWIGQAFVLEDLGSTNGTFVNGKRVQRRSLASGDILQLGPSVRLRFDVLDASEAELRRTLFVGNVRDPTTRLFRRDHLDEQVRLEVAHGRRNETDFAVLLVRPTDIEGLDPHAVDRLVGQLAARVLECGRIEDLVARFDDATVAMLRRATDLAEAKAVAAAIHAAVDDRPFELLEAPRRQMVAIGLATLEHLDVFAEHDALLEDAESFLARALRDGPGSTGHP